MKEQNNKRNFVVEIGSKQTNFTKQGSNSGNKTKTSVLKSKQQSNNKNSKE